MPRLFFVWEISAGEGQRVVAKVSAAVWARAMLMRWASSREANLLTQPPMHLVDVWLALYPYRVVSCCLLGGREGRNQRRPRIGGEAYQIQPLTPSCSNSLKR
jgi:hypothetical protein